MDLNTHVVETGLVEAAAEQAKTTATVKLPAMNMQLLAALAREVAMDIREVEDILPDYKLSQEQYTRLLTHPFYEKALQSAVIEWNSAISTHHRLKIEAAAALEHGLPKLHSRMVNPNESLPAAVEVGKLFAKIAGIGEQGQTAAGEKFTISINLGSDTTTRTLDVTPRAEARAAPASEPALVSEEPRVADSAVHGVPSDPEG
jgi:hypothetical protein